MNNNLRGWLFPILIGALVTGMAHAAPDRLNDDVPDAIPDHPGAVSLSYGYEGLSLDSPGSGERTSHMYYRGRYTFSDKVAASFRVTDHDLAGGLGLISPLLDYQDSAKSYTLDLTLNLLNVPATPADPDNEVAFAAGSAFNAGVSGTQYQLDAGGLSRDETLMKAYLMYSTDLTEEMRAHTYFSTGRLSGDTHTGSMNRVGAGLDYALIDGRRPLTLMANGILDIYNFREPSFNTGRVSRFDLGMRYRVSRDWYASVGWVTANDSENETSGSGIFAGLNFISHPGKHDDCVACGTAGEETPAPAEGAQGEEALPVEEAAPVEEAPPPVQDAVRGVAIPSFGDIPPQHTTAGSSLVRAGQGQAQPPAPPAGEKEPAPEPPAAEEPQPEAAPEGDAVETVDQPQEPAGGEEQPDAG
jgi:hypothetical protein